jgi:hypothetical protein
MEKKKEKEPSSSSNRQSESKMSKVSMKKGEIRKPKEIGKSSNEKPSANHKMEEKTQTNVNFEK